MLNNKYGTSNKYGKIHLNHTPNHSIKTLTTDYFITQFKRTTLCTNAQQFKL